MLVGPFALLFYKLQIVFFDMRAVTGPLERRLGDRGSQTGAPREGLGTKYCNISTGYHQIAPPLTEAPRQWARGPGPGEAQRQHSKDPAPTASTHFYRLRQTRAQPECHLPAREPLFSWVAFKLLKTINTAREVLTQPELQRQTETVVIIM